MRYGQVRLIFRVRGRGRRRVHSICEIKLGGGIGHKMAGWSDIYLIAGEIVLAAILEIQRHSPLVVRRNFGSR